MQDEIYYKTDMQCMFSCPAVAAHCGHLPFNGLINDTEKAH